MEQIIYMKLLLIGIIFLKNNGVEFLWETEVTDIDFNNKLISLGAVNEIEYDKLIFGVGKSGY